MQGKQIKSLCFKVATFIAAAFLLNACSGNDGKNGNNALETTGVISAKTLTADDLRNVALDGVILNASIPGNQPVVKFQVRNKYTQKGITGLSTFSLHIAQLKPELNGSNSYWMNYIADGLPLSAIPANTERGASTQTAPVNPSADAVTVYNADGTVKAQGYSVVDHGDGTYTVTFGANIMANPNVPYDASLVHRIAVGVRSVATPGVSGITPDYYAGPINPATGTATSQFLNTNGTVLSYDFVPATNKMLTDSNGKQAFARDIVTIAACNQCHYKIEYGSNNTSGHFGSRPDTKVCVVCHTRQIDGGAGEFTTFIHQIHMGEELPDRTVEPVGVAVGEFKYPQDIRNCTFCHKGADVDNWMTKPSRKACGSCHNNMDFTTANINHKGSSNIAAQTDDSLCLNCHAPTGIVPVSAKHLPISPPDPDNAVSLAFNNISSTANVGGSALNTNTNASYVVGASTSRLPVGAKLIKYVVNKVYRNASKQPVIEFKLQVATADANGVLGAYSDQPLNVSNGTNELITGFVGSPSVYFAWSVPQDSIAAPVDYNASASGYLKRIWNGTAVKYGGTVADATLTGPVDGYYTVTLIGQQVPDNANMLTGGLGYTYGLGTWKKPTTVPSGADPWVLTTSQFRTTTMPLTQIDLADFPYTAYNSFVGTGGLSVPAVNVYKVATKDANTTTAMATARRVIVDNAKCNACHGRLGVKPTFHAGQRNDAPTCTFCHNVNRTNSGWAVNIKEDVHAIHAASKRLERFSWEATAGAKYWQIGYPGVLKNCELCHVPGFYDFSASAYTANGGAILDSMLFSTTMTGKSKTFSSTVYTLPNMVAKTAAKELTSPITVNSTDTVYAPYVLSATDYGVGFSFNAGSVTGSAIKDNAGTVINTGLVQGTSFPLTTDPVQMAEYNKTLVSSPISSACFACHDTAQAKAHMVGFGGSVNEARLTALAKKETCLVCHASVSASNATNDTTPALKAVHRWW